MWLKTNAIKGTYNLIFENDRKIKENCFENSHWNFDATSPELSDGVRIFRKRKWNRSPPPPIEMLDKVSVSMSSFFVESFGMWNMSAQFCRYTRDLEQRSVLFLCEWKLICFSNIFDTIIKRAFRRNFPWIVHFNQYKFIFYSIRPMEILGWIMDFNSNLTFDQD